MRSAAVYSCEGPSSKPQKEVLIHDQISAALTSLANLDRHALSSIGSDATGHDAPMPGLTQIRGGEPVIALGRAAHVLLADVEKRTLICGDLDLEGDDCGLLTQDIEQLVWSCTNTLRIVALGETAWQSVQLLPVSSRRFYNIPPLCLGAATSETAERRVLVINHDADDSRAKALADVLDRHGMAVECAGLLSTAVAGWSDTASIHVHVGEHTLSASEPRLIDSWCSDRFALQLVPRRGANLSSNPNVLMIEDEANGFICDTYDAVVMACHELLEDRVLQRKVIAAGQNSVAPLVKTWLAVAEDLLS